MSASKSTGNEGRLFWASFLTLIAAGIGFSVRGGILREWAAQFGFTQSELGSITGGGLTGFGITIIVLSLVVDKIGYGPLMILAFILHTLSVVVTVAATPAFDLFGKDAAYECLFWGMFLFALGNGTCEAVINPLTATLYKKEKTHWLNILHAGWPGGLILGALLVLAFNFLGDVRWEIKIATYLVPTLMYGALMFRQRFPQSEAKVAGVKLGTMLLVFLSPVLLLLLLLHAMVGYVELGTDSWIQNITGTILDNPTYGIYLFIWTSGLMFVLRFFAGPIVHKISPLGLLFVSAIIGALGLTMLGYVGTGFMYGGKVAIISCVIAATIYGFGKTFLWPTMLGVVSERFPKGGALALGAMGGIGMLSAGLLGGPGIGYKQDFYASKQLKTQAPSAYERYKSGDTKSFLMFPEIAGLDGAKVAIVNDSGEQAQKDIDALEKSGRQLSDDKNLAKLAKWWDEASKHEQEDKAPVNQAGLYGSRMALRWTALVPAMMAIGYLLLILYFKTQGGYKVEVLETQD